MATKINFIHLNNVKKNCIFLFVFSIFICSVANSETEIQDCNEAQRMTFNIPKKEQLALIDSYYRPLYNFIKSPAGSNCQAWIIEKIYYERAQVLLAYAKSDMEGIGTVKNFSNQAAEAFLEYLKWWSNLDDTDKDNVFKSYIQNVDLNTSRGREKKNNWLRQRPGNVVFALIDARVLSTNISKLLDDLELFSQDIYIFNQESVLAWDKWLSAQDDFLRERKLNEIKQINEKCEDCKGRWKAYVEFLDRWLTWNKSAIYKLKDRKTSLTPLIFG